MSLPETSLIVRPAEPRDEAAWRQLFSAYNRFYRAQVPDEVATETWRRIVDPGAEIGSVVAERVGALAGFANYLFHPSTWNTAPACYLEDLFVDPAQRGGGAARALIEAVEAIARARGAFRLYWHTQEYNAPARSLYDTVTPRSSFIVYRKALGEPR